MKKKHLLAAFLCFGVLSVQSIHSHGTEEQYIMATQEPPAELEEKIPASPSPNHIWVKGNWKWVGRWEWIQGRWVEKPHQDSTWTAGHWIKKPNHWLWIPGHWQ